MSRPCEQAATLAARRPKAARTHDQTQTGSGAQEWDRQGIGGHRPTAPDTAMAERTGQEGPSKQAQEGDEETPPQVGGTASQRVPGKVGGGHRRGRLPSMHGWPCVWQRCASDHKACHWHQAGGRHAGSGSSSLYNSQNKAHADSFARNLLRPRSIIGFRGRDLGGRMSHQAETKRRLRTLSHTRLPGRACGGFGRGCKSEDRSCLEKATSLRASMTSMITQELGDSSPDGPARVKNLSQGRGPKRRVRRDSPVIKRSLNRLDTRRWTSPSMANAVVRKPRRRRRVGLTGAERLTETAGPGGSASPSTSACRSCRSVRGLRYSEKSRMSASDVRWRQCARESKAWWQESRIPQNNW